MPNIYQYDWMKIKENFEILSHMHIHIGIKYIWNSKFWEKCVFFVLKMSFSTIFDFYGLALEDSQPFFLEKK